MQQPAHEFLRHILPVEGYKCAFVIDNKQQSFFASTDDLADFILTQDALGRTVYHACASFAAPGNRKQDNAIGARSFWLDVDAGPGKPYAHKAAAWNAFERFQQQHGLPAPTVVDSGHGLHLYWALVEMLPVVAWRAAAARLKSLCEAAGFETDRVRTADISSILRTPATHNRKHGGFALVHCLELAGPYRLEELGAFTNGDAKDVSELRTTVFSNVAHVVQTLRSRSLHAAALNIYDTELPDADSIAGSCNQIRLFRDLAGKLPEPTWYAGVGLVIHCRGGQEIAHEWSSGHPNYTHAETQERIERTKAFGPTTCAKLESVNPKGCQGCQYRGRITSPIQLGRSKLNDNTTQERDQETVSPVGQEILTYANGTRYPKAPQGFTLDHSGLWFERSKDDANIKELISTSPIYLDSIQTGEITTESFSLGFKLHLPNSEVKNVSLPARTFFSSHGMSEMHGRGAVIHDSDLFKKYVRESMDLWHQNNKLQMSYDQFGWKDGEQAFLCGDKLYTANAVVPVVGSDEIKTRSQYLGPTRTGSLERWSRAANALFTKGCEPQSFALLAAFAAPLMRFHSSGEGGAIVSLVSDQSGSGKTTALEAVASVWGRLKGVQITDDDTRVSKGLMLGVLGNLPCTYDELYNRDPEVIRQFVLMFTNGRDKMRGTQDGKLRHSKAEWQTIMVLGSNNSIVDILSTMDGTDAPAFRLLEFNCELPAGVDNGDALKRELAANSGFAGDLYLKTLLQPETLAYVKQALPQWTDNLWKRTGLRNEHRFWIRTLASVVAAGVLVRHVGILDFSVQRILDWAVDRVRASAQDATVTGIRDPISSLSEFLHSHINDMLVVADEWKPHTQMRPLIEPRRNLFIRYEIGVGRVYILESELRKWLVKKGIGRQTFLDELRTRHIIVGERRRITLGAGTDYASGQATVFEINMRHPAMSGVAVNVEQLVPKGPQNTRAERIANMGVLKND